VRSIKIISLVLGVCLLQPLNGQILQAGSKFPDITMPGVINYKEGSLKINDFKGKAILIDLWNTRCTACFKLFPKLDSLQKLFSDQLQIILVNPENKVNTEEFFRKHPKIFKPSLPMVTGGTAILDLFPVDGYPYTVWIDEKGFIKYFSAGTSVTQINIENFLVQKNLTLIDPTKVKFGSSADRNKFEFFSSIAHCNDSLDIGHTDLVRIKEGKAVSITSNCSSIKELYRQAFSEKDKYNFNTPYSYILNANHKFQYGPPSNSELPDDWLKEHAYNYELLLTVNKVAIAYKIMQQDLERYFGLQGRIEKRLVTSVVIKKKSANVHAQKKSNNITGDTVLYFNNIPFSQFVRELSVRLINQYPFFDETGYSGNITCRIKYSSLDPLNISSLQSDLVESGFDLLLCKREIPVLIVGTNIKGSTR